MSPLFFDITQKLADILQKTAATFALIIGGLWVLRNYRRNRTHKPRLQVAIEAKIIGGDQQDYLLAKLTVTNVGLSLIQLPRPDQSGAGLEGCALLIRPHIEDEATTDIIDSEWGDDHAFGVLSGHNSVEPGLAIYEQRLVRLPHRAHLPYNVRFTVVAEGRDVERGRDRRWRRTGTGMRRSHGVNRMTPVTIPLRASRQMLGPPGAALVEWRLEEEDPVETARIERLKKEQKEREKLLAEQRRKAREKRQGPPEAER